MRPVGGIAPGGGRGQAEGLVNGGRPATGPTPGPGARYPPRVLGRQELGRNGAPAARTSGLHQPGDRLALIKVMRPVGGIASGGGRGQAEGVVNRGRQVLRRLWLRGGKSPVLVGRADHRAAANAAAHEEHRLHGSPVIPAGQPGAGPCAVMARKISWNRRRSGRCWRQGRGPR
jgi:hypothetical protein